MRKALVNVGLVLATLLATFAIAELAVRALLAESSVLFPRYHTDYQYGPYHLRGMRPDATFWHTSIDGRWKFVTNSKGLRDTREFPYDKPAGTYRVLSIGDSHTQGYEARQEGTFSAVLERFLQRQGRKAEVLNAGVSGFSTAEALAFLENEGHRYQPDAVLLGFFGNDFEDNFKAPLFDLDQQGGLVAKAYEHIPGVRIQNLIYAVPGVKWLSENSYFYSLLFNTVWIYYKFRLADQVAAPAGREVAEYAVPTEVNPSDREILLAARLLERMKAFCDRHGMRLILADIPFPADRYRFNSSLPPQLRERLDAAGIEFIHSDALLKPYEGSVEVHVPNGYQHISEFSHALIGVEAGRRLLEAPRR